MTPIKVSTTVHHPIFGTLTLKGEIVKSEDGGERLALRSAKRVLNNSTRFQLSPDLVKKAETDIFSQLSPDEIQGFETLLKEQSNEPDYIRYVSQS